LLYQLSYPATYALPYTAKAGFSVPFREKHIKYFFVFFVFKKFSILDYCVKSLQLFLFSVTVDATCSVRYAVDSVCKSKIIDANNE
ncbi:MAG: hypothetical protein J6W90_04380, partial [Verrucomicrobia bacterium]|nr:hypothetical protein [Verrucomicrobiota bacterium]